MWVTDTDSASIFKVRASDGEIKGRFSCGKAPYDICFDGENIWVADLGWRYVHKLRLSDGEILETFLVDNAPYGIYCDGENIWVSSYIGDSVIKLYPQR